MPAARPCETCRDLLNEALNLAVRSDQFEAQNRRQAALDASHCPDDWITSGRFDAYVERYNLHNPHKPMATRSMTMHLWVQDQYDKDLTAWQAKDAWDANQGDMNDALALVFSLLPGARINVYGPNNYGWSTTVFHSISGKNYYCDGRHPTSLARALLLATLRAYRDTLGEGD